VTAANGILIRPPIVRLTLVLTKAVGAAPARPWRIRLAGAALSLAVLLPACTAPGALQDLRASAKRAAATVDRGDALLYSNRYLEAAREYQMVVAAHPDDPAAHAHLALFANYLTDHTTALAQARYAVDLAPDDGYALTVLTRVLDWSRSYDDAVLYGARATRAQPSSVLAHAFYGEALADAGRTEEARQELARAEALLTKSRRSAYERAEVARNWANYYQRQGQPVEEARELQRALAAQPDWVERTLELARYHLAHQNLDKATEYLQRSAALQPKDPSLREEVGLVAIFAQDYDTAKQAFGGAAALPGHRAYDVPLLAHIAVARDRNFDQAVTYLEGAMERNPGDLTAAAYLTAVYRYLLHDEPAARATARGEGPDPLSGAHTQPAHADVDDLAREREQEALLSVNRLRALAGVAPVVADPRLGAGAQAHAYYFLFNHASSGVRGLGIHDEVEGMPGFSGATVRTRARHFGVEDLPSGEVITHRGDPTAAIVDWVNTVYHRFPLLRRDLQALGYGQAAVGALPIEVMDFAFRARAVPGRGMVSYPVAGQVNVPTAFYGNEIPDPVPNAAYPVGYPITLTFDRGARVQIASHHLRDGDGQEVDAHVLLPSDSAMEDSLALLARRPLQPSTTYLVEVTGTLEGAPFEKRWQFTTATSGSTGS
jgi:tetratricopeptide (TPR) repeat protein